MKNETTEIDYGERNQNMIEDLRVEFDLLEENHNQKNIKRLVDAIEKSIDDTNSATDSNFLKVGEVVSALCYVLEQNHKRMVEDECSHCEDGKNLVEDDECFHCGNENGELKKE